MRAILAYLFEAHNHFYPHPLLHLSLSATFEQFLVLPEYMLFFDLWEPSILWRGRLDVANNKIVEGEVTTNKKRFGLFPYTETLATFEAELLAPGQKLPTVVLPNFSDLRFTVSGQFRSHH
jgi:hypothetical protein